MKQKSDIKIFVSLRNDMDSEVVKGDYYFPVICGSVFDERNFCSYPGDDTGENISDKAFEYNELTVLYWAWKNVDADFYGLCHYRRYFSFADKTNLDCYANIVADYIDSRNIAEYHLCDKNRIERLVKEYDFIVSEPFDVSKAPQHFTSVLAQYGSVKSLDIKDLEKTLDVIKKLYPDYLPVAKSYFDGKLLYACNMFIASKELFQEYCSWLFSILQELEKEIDTTFCGREGKRKLAMIGERLLGVFFEHLKSDERGIRTHTLQRVFFSKPQQIHPHKNFDSKNTVTLVLGSSDYYVPYMAVSLYSALKNASKNYCYDVFILQNDISKYMEKALRDCFSSFSNIRITLLDLSPYVSGLKLQSQFEYASAQSFYRLMVPDLFKDFKNVIYLDSDLIVRGDVSQLHEMDLGGNMVAAVIDPDVLGEYAVFENIKKYIDSDLKLDNPRSYFQAGVMVFNIPVLNKLLSKNELLDFAAEKKFVFGDQDVLNKKCEGKVKYLDPRWNVMVDCGYFRIKNFIENAPFDIYRNYLASRKNPLIIHYAGYEKPWSTPLSDFSSSFWEFARQTSFYEAIIIRNMYEAKNYWRSVLNPSNNLQGTSSLRKLADRLLPHGTRRRSFARTIAHFLRVV